MKTITQEFKNKIKSLGRELDSVIAYELNEETIILGNTDINSISPHYEGNILKSVMKQIDIDSNTDIPLNTVINYQFGVKVRNEEVEDYRDNYDYINYGNYVVYKSEKQEDTNSYKITCYDKMLYSMKEYENLSITYPITIRNYINTICTHLGLTFANLNDTFANYDKEIPNELYLSYDSDTQTFTSLGYTFRDVLDELAEVTASTICINDDDELEIRYINDTNDTIDKEYLKDINVNFGEQYGAINTIVLSRSAGADNVYYPSPLPETPVELKISDNQIMNGNDRANYLPDIYTKLNGLTYYINDFSSTGICYYELCDRYNVSIGENTYSCVMFNDNVQISQGLQENIYTDLPEESVTDYTKADSTDRKINQTNLIVDKQQGIIESLVSNTTYVSDTKTGTGSIQLENAYKGQLYQLSIKGNISLLFPQSSVQYGYPLVPSDTLTPSNTLTPSSPVPYGNEIHYPSSSLYSKSNILLIDDKEYELDFDFLNYMNETICDEFIYDNGNCYIIRRVGIDSLGNKYALDNEVIEPRQSVTLEVDKDSIISLKSFSNAILSATYLLQNTFTDNFATEVYVQSSIKQTADSITEQVVKNDEVVAKLNLAIEEGQGVINLIGNQVTIDSDHFKLNANGDIEAANAVITGGSLELKDPDSNATIIEINRYYNSNDNLWYGYLYCSQYDGTETEIKPAKIMLAGSSGIDYVFLNGTTGEIDATGTITSQNGVCQGSREEIKKNFEKFNNALDIINNVDIYKYHLKGQDNSEKKHIGFVIGDKYKYNEAITTQNNDCVDLYSFVSVCCQAIKEQQKQIEELTQKIEKLERESDK